jgi:hypothetical protein
LVSIVQKIEFDNRPGEQTLDWLDQESLFTARHTLRNNTRPSRENRDKDSRTQKAAAEDET